MKKDFIDICYIISHGFASRMVLQTGLLSKLSSLGLKVAVIVPDKKDKVLKLQCKNAGISIYEFKEQKRILSDDGAFRRKYFLEDIQKNPALWEKHQLSIKGNTSRHPWRKIRPYVYYGIYNLRKKFPSIKSWYARFESRQMTSKVVQSFLKEINPSILISTYPVNMEEAMILHNANVLGLKTVIHLLSWDNISAKGHFPALADYYISWGPIMTNEFKEYYNIAEENIFETGVPHFDLHIQTKTKQNHSHFIMEAGLDSMKPYLFFGMSSPRFAPNEIDIVEKLAKDILEDEYGSDMQLLIRPHPQNVTGNLADPTWLPRLHKLESQRIKIDWPDMVESGIKYSMENNDMIRLSNLLFGAQIVLNSGSTISIDALMLDKPVIITSFDADEKLPYWRSARRLIDYTHLKKFVDLGGAVVVTSFEDMKKGLYTFIQNSKFKLEQRILTRSLECMRDDGLATERVVNTLQKINEKYKESNENPKRLH